MQRSSAARHDEAEELGGLFPRRIRKYDLIYVTNQLAIMVDTGITLSVALGSIMQQEQNPDAAESAERAQIAALSLATIFPPRLPGIQSCSTKPTFR